MEIIMYIAIYFVGLGIMWEILKQQDDFDGEFGIFMFFLTIWPITFLYIVGKKIGSKISKYFTVIFMLLFFSCSPNVYSCKYKHKQIEKNSNLSGKQLAKRMK